MNGSALARSSQETLARHGRSFRWAQLFLGASQRRDSALAYAFCRMADDCVDEAPNASEARRRLAALRSSLEETSPASPLVAEYRDMAQRRGFGLEPARELLSAMKTDLGVVRVNDRAELFAYCYGAAGTVGLMMCGILGVQSELGRERAIDLGVAMQLTNICRDVKEDAQRGRVYLPANLLARHELKQEDLLDETRMDAGRRRRLAEATREVLALAEFAYASARRGYIHLPWRARLAVAVAAELYRGIGRHLLRAQGADPWRGRTRVPFPGKCWLVVRALGVWLWPSSWFGGKGAEAPAELDFPLSRRDATGP